MQTPGRTCGNARLVFVYCNYSRYILIGNGYDCEEASFRCLILISSARILINYDKLPANAENILRPSFFLSVTTSRRPTLLKKKYATLPVTLYFFLYFFLCFLPKYTNQNKKHQQSFRFHAIRNAVFSFSIRKI